MFENILYQKRTVDQLVSDIRSRQLPGALLFHGPAASGKLTAALELARAVSCQAQGAWNCTCSTCAHHRILAYPGLVIVGEKDLAPEIDAAADILKKQAGPAQRYLYIRTLRKLLKRFEPMLWEGEEAKMKPLGPVIESIQEELEGFYPGKDLPSGEKLEVSLKKIREGASKLLGALPAKGVPIAMIRKLAFWARTTAAPGGTFIIIENADSLAEGSRNSLLKILEEPPEGVTFLLLTRHKGAIMPTILSRVRPYSFQDRTPQQAQDILSRLYLETSGEYTSLNQFFQAYGLEGEGQLSQASRDFLEGCAAGLPLTLPPLDWSAQFRPFLLSLAEEDRKTRTPGSGPDRPREKRLADLQEALESQENLNISPTLLLETLYYKWRQPGAAR